MPSVSVKVASRRKGCVLTWYWELHTDRSCVPIKRARKAHRTYELAFKAGENAANALLNGEHTPTTALRLQQKQHPSGVAKPGLHLKRAASDATES